MKAQAESINPVKTKITIEVDADDFNKQLKTELQKIRQQAAIRGFRKGKAPIETVERLYGDQARSEVVGNLIQSTYVQALRDQDVHPVNEGDIEVQKMNDDGSFTYTAVVEVRPTVTPTGYEGLALKREKVEVSDLDLEGRLEQIRQQSASFEPAEEGYAAQDGDMTVIDFIGRIDGEEFEGGKAEGHTLQIGSGRMIPGFEEGVIGAKAGETVEVKVTFPDEYAAADLAGKDAAFEVKVTEIKQSVLPEIDDDFAQNVAQMDDLEALKSYVRDSLVKEQEARVARDFRAKLVDMLLDANPFEVPDCLVAQQQESATQRMKAEFQQRGMDLDKLQMDDPKFAEQAHASATRAVRWAFLVDAIAEAHSVQVTDEDIQARIQEIADADGRPVEMVRGFFERDDNIDSLRSRLREDMTIDKITEKATIEDVDAEGWAEWSGAE
jgi:trigger factor